MSLATHEEFGEMNKSKPINAAGATAKTKPHGDWSQFLGSTASAGMTSNAYPSKYTFDSTATPDCVKDFVVVPVNKPPGTGTPSKGYIDIASPFCANSLATIDINGVTLGSNATKTNEIINISTTVAPTTGTTIAIPGEPGNNL